MAELVYMENGKLVRWRISDEEFERRFNAPELAGQVHKGLILGNDAKHMFDRFFPLARDPKPAYPLTDEDARLIHEAAKRGDIAEARRIVESKGLSWPENDIVDKKVIEGLNREALTAAGK